MAKQPAAGSTKTRMSPTLSPQQAADLYEGLLFDTFEFLQKRTDCTTVVAIDEPGSAAYFERVAPTTAQILQVGDALGDRLASVLTECLAQGFSSAFAISSDSPDLPATHLDDAFAALDRADVDVVLGPTVDGGYYLIGWKQPWPEMVREVQMSTERVLEDTLAVAAGLGASVHLSPSWYDVDVSDDLDRLRQSPAVSAIPHTVRFLDSLC